MISNEERITPVSTPTAAVDAVRHCYSSQSTHRNKNAFSSSSVNNKRGLTPNSTLQMVSVCCMFTAATVTVRKSWYTNLPRFQGKSNVKYRRA